MALRRGPSWEEGEAEAKEAGLFQAQSGEIGRGGSRGNTWSPVLAVDSRKDQNEHERPGGQHRVREKFSICGVASFVPRAAVAIIEAHIGRDVMNHSNVRHQNLSRVEQLPRWAVLNGQVQLNMTLGWLNT